MSETTINDLFGVAIAAERAAETVYNRFAEMFAADDDLVTFWKKYATEETGHATWLENMRNRASDAQLAAPPDSNVAEMMRALQGMSPDALLAKIHNLDDAYQLAHEMEHSEVNVVFNFLVDNFAADESAQLFLRTQLKSHVSHLVLDIPAQFRGVTARMAVKALRVG